jgi:hypothetical protein
MLFISRKTIPCYQTQKNVRAFECRIKHRNRHPELIQYGTNLREKEEGAENMDKEFVFNLIVCEQCLLYISFTQFFPVSLMV